MSLRDNNSQLWPVLSNDFKVSAWNTGVHIFLSQVEWKSILYQKTYPRMYDNLDKSFSKYESHPCIFANAGPHFVETGC